MPPGDLVFFFFFLINQNSPAHLYSRPSCLLLSQKSLSREGELEVEDRTGVENMKGKKVPLTHRKSQSRWYFG